MKNKLRLIITFLFAVSLLSCSDKFEGDVVRDALASIPVTYDGSTTVGFNPYYNVSYGTGTTAFTLTLSIPADAPLKIKEVTKIVTGTTAINVATLDGTAGQYLVAPVAVNGNTYTLSTSITEYNTKVTGTTRITSAPAAGTFSERAFMIKLTMSDDSTIIPVQVRIRVNP